MDWIVVAVVGAAVLGQAQRAWSDDRVASAMVWVDPTELVAHHAHGAVS